MPYNFVADSFHRKKLCSIDFFKRSPILRRKRPLCVFELLFGDVAQRTMIILGSLESAFSIS